MQFSLYRSCHQVNEIRPALHQVSPLFEVLAVIVSGADCVLVPMRELPLNDLRTDAQFMEHRRCGRAKAVSREADGTLAVETHRLERAVECRGSHASVGIAIVREKIISDACVGMEFAEKRDCLPGQRHYVGLGSL